MIPPPTAPSWSLGRWLRNLLFASILLYAGYRYFFFAAIESGRADYGSGSALTQIALVGILLAAALRAWSPRLPPRLRIDRDDLIFFFIFWLMAGPLMLSAVTFLKGSTYAYYLGTRSEATHALLQVGLPPLAPSEEAIERLYRGSPTGRIPWTDWFTRPRGAHVSPAVGWGLYLLFFLGLAFGTGMIFARRWVQEEQLAFPMARTGELLVDGFKNPVTGARLPLFRTPAFWIGLAATFLFQLATYFSPGLEFRLGSFAIPSTHPLLGAMDYASRQFWWRPVFLGLLILCPRPILGSALIFNVCLSLVTVIGAGMGYKGYTGSGLPGATVFPFKQDQLIGGSIAMALLMIWRGRSDLSAQARSLVAFLRRHPSSPSLPFPSGMALWILSVVGFLAWTLWIGFPLRTAVFFLGCLLLGILVNARGRAESGMPLIVVFASFNPLILTPILGTRLLGEETLAASALYGWLFWNNVAHVTPSLMDSLKLGDSFRCPIRWAAAVAASAVVIGLAMAIVIVFQGAYSHGIEQWHYRWGSGHPEITHAYSLLKRDAGINLLHLAAAMGGAMMVALLVAGRTLFPGFLLHPMGYLLSLHSGLHHFSLSLIIAYVVKSLCLHYGGLKAYVSAVPLFIGLLCGQILGSLLGGLLNVLLGTSIYFPSE